MCTSYQSDDFGREGQQSLLLGIPRGINKFAVYFHKIPEGWGGMGPLKAAWPSSLLKQGHLAQVPQGTSRQILEIQGGGLDSLAPSSLQNPFRYL